MTLEKKEDGALVISEGKFTDREEAAFRSHMAARDAPLSTKTQEEMYTLYLHGYTCEQIQALNRSVRLGAIVRAAKEHNWYDRRNSYQDNLFDKIGEVVRQTQAESVAFVATTLQVAHKKYGEKMALYLQTGDEKYLEGVPDITNLPMYHKVVETLLKLTGQDNQKSVKSEHKSEVKLEIATRGMDKNNPMFGPIVAEQAAQLVKSLHGSGALDDEDD